MNLLQEFCRQINFYIGDIEADQLDPETTSDMKDFVSVDGEEGDYGVIRYYSKSDNQLLAIRTIHGGDSEDVEFTAVGAGIFQHLAVELLKSKFKDVSFTE